MELFKILGTIAIDGSGAKSELEDVTGIAEKSHSKISGAFEKIGSAAVNVGKTMAAGFAAGATAMAGLTTKALNLAGELEQNLGGSEAVYGKYAENMQKKASKAYKNMGLAASDYLATANKMGALFKGAGFDAAEASELSAESMQRAADVASIMGISVESAMESVAGAAKGNFTMMDNLGVAMNETNLEAYALSKGIKKAYTEMTQQEKIGLAMEMFLEKTSYAAGNYAKENETLAGSLGTAKAALSNFLSGAGTASEVVESVVNAGRVVAANLNRLLPDLVAGLNRLITELLPYLPELLNSLLPGIIQGAVALLNGLVRALPTILQILIEQIPYIVTEIGKGLAEAFPILLETVKSLFGQIFDYISLELLNTGVSFEDAFSKMSEISNAVWGEMKAFWEETGQPMWDKISGALKTFSEKVLKPLIETYLTNLKKKFEMMVETCKVVKEAFVENVQPAIENIMEKFGELADLVMQAVEEYIVPVIESFVGMVQELWKENKEKLSLIGELFTTIFNTISENVTIFIEKFKEKFLPFLEEIKEFVDENLGLIKNIFQNVIDAITGIVQAFIALFKGDWEGLWKAVQSILESAFLAIRGVFELIGAAISEKVLAIKEDVTTKFEEIKEGVTEKITAVKDKVAEIFDNIKSTISEKIKAAKDVVEDVVDSIKDFFDFEFNMPEIKLPHFSIEPEGWKLADLLDGVIPELGIEWYAKGGVMENPTAFGMNGNRLMVGGESGPEAIAPIDVLQGYIAEAVASQNVALVAVLQQILEAILSMDENMGGNLRDALEGTALEVNRREFARLVKAVN